MLDALLSLHVCQYHSFIHLGVNVPHGSACIPLVTLGIWGRQEDPLIEPILEGLGGSEWVSGLNLSAPDPNHFH